MSTTEACFALRFSPDDLQLAGGVPAAKEVDYYDYIRLLMWVDLTYRDKIHFVYPYSIA